MNGMFYKIQTRVRVNTVLRVFDDPKEEKLTNFILMKVFGSENSENLNETRWFVEELELICFWEVQQPFYTKVQVHAFRYWQHSSPANGFLGDKDTIRHTSREKEQCTILLTNPKYSLVNKGFVFLVVRVNNKLGCINFWPTTTTMHKCLLMLNKKT